jgi:hypothetical protein
MLEVFMSTSALCGREGALVCVSISVEPRHLESLLEALASVSFPINPEIYHDAAVVYRFADEHEESQATTLVEFPAYENQLEEVAAAVAAFGFDPACLHVRGMLDEIQAEQALEPAPQGAAYLGSYRVKRRSAAG